MKPFISTAFKLIIFCAIIVGCIRSCLGLNGEPQHISSVGIESFYLADSDPVHLVIGQNDRHWFSVKTNNRRINLSEKDFVFISSDESVATFTLDKRLSPEGHLFYYYINAVGIGTTKVHLESSDGIIKSEEVIVTVTENTTAVHSDIADNQKKDGI